MPESKHLSKKIKTTISILLIFILTSSCNQHYLVECRNFDCIEKNKNKNASIHGLLRNYTPTIKVKDKSAKFITYELLLADSVAIPIRESDISYHNYLGKQVIIDGFIFYGVVMGQDDGRSSFATGFRIEIDKIREAE